MPPRRTIKPELPRSEPEIIPPPRARTQPYQADPDWFAGRDRGSSRIFVARLGPSWGIVGFVLLLGLFAGIVLAMLLGALLIAIPIVGLLIAGVLIANALRTRLRGPR